MKQIYAIGIIAVGILMTACRTPKNVTYLQDLKDGETVKVLNYKGITLRPQDAVSIVVNTKTTELTNLLNLPLSTQVIGAPQTAALAQSHGTSGYTLDSEGNVDFPLVGKIHLAGLTREEAAARVKQTLEEKQVAANPVVTVEFLNLKFSVLGEVGHAGEFGINRDKTTLIEALGMAGDMNLYGKRDSVFVYRQEGDHQRVYALSMLNGRELLSSPAYYIQQGDVVYVQPNNYRKRQSSANATEVTTASFWLSALSVLTTLAVLVFK
jgi:polysaccharide export outer membrane protein